MEHKIIKKLISSVLLCSMLAYTMPVFAFTKEETVYSKLDSNGNVYEQIVNEHIQNENQEKLINDLSDLLNIKNTSGEEEYTQNGTSIVWNAEGSDIYYQGETQKELPIECKITYTIDDKEITAEELAGKTGKVKIKIEYINKDKHVVNINGKKEELYTPFVVVCGTIIDNENNRNITITNGKVIDNGDKTTVVGIAVPGMQESLGISSNKINIPDTIEITMDATDFTLSSIVTYVTPKVIEDSDLELFNNIDSIYNQVNTLQDASKDIEEGANALKEGSNGLTEGSQKLKNGASSAYNGAKMIKSEVLKSTESLKTDKTDALDAETLQAIKKQAEASSILTEEQKQQIANQAQASVALGESETVIRQGINAEVTETIGKMANKITASIGDQSMVVEAEYNAQKEAIMATLPDSLSADEKEAIFEMMKSNAINVANKTAQNVGTKISSELAASSNSISSALADKTIEIAETVAKTTAEKVAVTVAQNTTTQTAGTTAVSTAKQVANAVKEQFTNQVIAQMGTLGSSLSELTKGLSELNNGMTELSEGTNTLNNGIITLADGITKFNNEGINTICNYINGDLKDITTRIEKLQELSEQYNNFTMLNDGTQGNVRFILIIDGIEKEEDKKQEIVLNDDNKRKEEEESTNN